MDKETKIERNKLIVRLRNEGQTIKQIAAQTNLTPAGIDRVLHIHKHVRSVYWL